MLHQHSRATVLAVNAGSSSLKLTLFPPDEPPLARRIERIGESGALEDHRAALQAAWEAWHEQGRLDALTVAGHRVVHGGEAFDGPVRINDAVLARLQGLSHLAPLHNPIALQCIEALSELAPALPQVACFDTAFHHTLPAHAFHYALPPRFYQQHGIRRYGFHGLSLAAVSRRAAEWLERPLAELNLIIAHLGNGASITALEGGRSVETSMGFTPLEGLVMGSRAGDLDPAIPSFLERQLGMRVEEVEQLLNQRSGLKGLCGHGDLREIHDLADHGDRAARLALQIYVHRIRKYIGAYTAVLGRVDGLIFTAGVGEHDARIREAVCAGLEPLGYVLQSIHNQQHRGGAAALQQPSSRTAIWVIPTDEEGEIAREALQTLGSIA